MTSTTTHLPYPITGYEYLHVLYAYPTMFTVLQPVEGVQQYYTSGTTMYDYTFPVMYMDELLQQKQIKTQRTHTQHVQHVML